MHREELHSDFFLTVWAKRYGKIKWMLKDWLREILNNFLNKFKERMKFFIMFLLINIIQYILFDCESLKNWLQLLFQVSPSDRFSIVKSSSLSSSRTFVFWSSMVLELMVLTSLWYGKALVQACPLHWP